MITEIEFLKERLDIWELLKSTKFFKNHDKALVELATDEVENIKERIKELEEEE